MNSLNFPDTNAVGSIRPRTNTQLALLRLLTTEAVMGRDVVTMVSAWDIYDQCCADEPIAFLAEPEALDPGLRRFSAGRRASPKLWADAYLAAFANTAGLKLITFDRAFRSKPVNCEILD